MVINHNLMANNATRSMNTNSANASKSMQKLSSGLRINSAADDAAGLSISEKMRAQIRGLDQASANAQDGISMVQTAEGALGETTSILQRMRELANQAANGTNTTADRTSMQDEINQLTSEINRIGNTTEFNTQKILNGGLDSKDGTKLTKAIGADKTLSAAMTTGTVATDVSATKTLTGNATTATVATAAKAKTLDITFAAGNIAAGTKITIDGKDYTNSAAITMTATAGAANAVLIGAGFKAADGTLLSDVANVAEGSANTAITIESKSSGPLSKVSVQNEASLTGGNNVLDAQGAGATITVDGKTFNLSGASIDVTDAAHQADTIATLGAIKAADGTKLSDAVDIKFNGGKLEFTSKTAGTGSSIRFDGVDAALGLQAGDEGVSHKATGTNGSRIVVDNTTFYLGGVTLDTTDATTRAASIEKLKAVTSSGTKLGDLVDIKDNNGKLEFVTKSTGKTSTIAFTSSATDAVLGTTVADAAANVSAATTTRGSDTTVERAGLQAGLALNSTADISIAANSTFKVAVGTDSDVTVTLNKTDKPAVYNTSSADANISKAEMDRLVKDVNAALQDAGLGGKVSASLSADNKIQFISEESKDIEVKDGTNTPLVSNLGFTDKTTDMGMNKNVQQVVGPGVQGSGFVTSFQIGANKGQSMSLSINDMRSAALGITGNAGQQGFTKTNGVTNGTTDVMQEAALNVVSKTDATKSLDVLDKAIATVSAERGKLGAVQNRLEHTIANLGTSSENLTSAESRIRDVDMAKEMSNYSKNNILSQAAQAMLTQANQNPQQVLQLLR